MSFIPTARLRNAAARALDGLEMAQELFANASTHYLKAAAGKQQKLGQKKLRENSTSESPD